MRPIIIAHRGASNLAPENTLAAFRLAKRLGADGIECDVQLTKDHQLVIAHDYFTDDHTGVKGDIYDMTLAELRQLDFGKWKSPEYEGEKIPTLDEVLEVGRDMKMLHIELKPYLDRDADFPERVVEAVCNAHMEDQVVLTSFQYGLLGRIKDDDFDRVIDVNLKGALFFCRAVIGTMIEQKRGVMIVLGSIDGVTGSAWSVDYSAAKSGMIGMVKGLAMLGAPHNVRACCVSPGPVLTRPGMANMPTPMGRAAEPQEVVDLILYLASDKAAFISGDNYLIDGARACMVR